jgi:hypothetical protein
MIWYDTHLETFPIHPGGSFLRGKAAAKWLSAKVKNEWSLDTPPSIWLHGLHKIFAHTCMFPIIYIYYNFKRIYSFHQCPSVPTVLVIHTYIHTYIHAYIHTYLHTYIHTCTQTYMLTCMHTYIHAYITYIHTYKHTFTHAYMHACIHTHIHAYIHTYIYT